MRLVAEADLGGYVSKGLPAEDALARGLQTSAEDVRMRRDPEDGRERPRELRRSGTDGRRRGGDRDALEQVRIEEGAEMIRLVSVRRK